MTWPTQQGVFDHGDLTLQSGARLPSARLSWKAHGTLSANRDNVIVYPTSYGAKHPDLEWLIGPDKILDPTRWFIIIPDMFGNGLSSSPSDTPDYPTLVTIHDNVQAQRHALHTLFGIDQVACVYGWSMEAAPEHLGNGRFAAEPRAAKRAFGRIYAAWGLSQDFYRAGLHLAGGPTPNLGAPDLETFLKTDWEDRFGARPAANLYAQLRTWDAADISANALYDGDLSAALRAIQARVLLMPGDTDLYFRTADNAAELPLLASAALRPIPSIWGHRAGNPVANPADMLFIKNEVWTWLAQ
jgi:homoserine O-acetyltransferase